MTDSSYYVYLHISSDSNTPFYVGKGKGNRAYVKHGRSNYWKNFVKKHGYYTEIIFEGLSEQEAFTSERDVITELKYFGYKLVNLTSGGEGTSGLVLSDEHKAKISLANKGKVRTQEAIDKSRIARTGLKKSEEVINNMRLAQLGKKATPETKNKMREIALCSGTSSDKTEYLFFNAKEDLIFIGTRRLLAKSIGKPAKVLDNLFLKNNPAKNCAGWGLMTTTLFNILVLNLN